MRGIENPDHGLYIVLEGDEGSGKTTQVKLLVDRLRACGISARAIREPGGDPVAEQIRQLVLFSEHPISPWTELHLFSAARANMLANVVAPLLQEGVWVIGDRSYASTIVYQGIARGLDHDERLRAFDGGDLAVRFRQIAMAGALPAMPNIQIILDLPLEVSLRRIEARDAQSDSTGQDRFEGAGLEFRRKVNEGYRQLAAFKGSYFQVDADQRVTAVHQDIWQQIIWYLAWQAGADLIEGQYEMSDRSASTRLGEKIVPILNRLAQSRHSADTTTTVEP